MITIDTSELRSTSKLPSYIPSTLEYFPLQGLEAKTGADLMVSPSGLPSPKTDFLLRKHIEAGARLVQIKFGHDLMASILDGRLKTSQMRMKLAGAAPWQRRLLFIGFVSHDEAGELYINNSHIYGSKTFKYQHYLGQVEGWFGGGGQWQELYPPTDLPLWLSMQEKALDNFRDNPQVNIWPTSPVLYEEELEDFDNTSFIQREWSEAQKTTLVDDIRVTWATMPGLGSKRANDVFMWMGENGVRQDMKGLMGILEDKRISEVPGVGGKTMEKIGWWLFRTKEEREENGK